MRGAGERVEVVVETPRGGFVKRRPDGAVDFVSPLPSPFNYGCVPGTVGGDGDPLDAIVLGPRLPAGAVVALPVVAEVRFVDLDAEDTKLVVSPHGLRRTDRARLVAFFRVYAWLKRGLALARGQRGRIAFEGLRAVPACPPGRTSDSQGP